MTANEAHAIMSHANRLESAMRNVANNATEIESTVRELTSPGHRVTADEAADMLQLLESLEGWKVATLIVLRETSKAGQS